jgi:hypothetical protein
MKKRAAVEAAKQEISTLEEALLNRLKAGDAVKPGLFAARVKVFERRNVAWRSVVERECGVEYAERVLASTRPATYENLVVEVSG